MSDSYVAHLEAQPDEWKRLRRLEDVVWNYLGTRDPTALADWIDGARLELAEHRAAEETPAVSDEPRGIADAIAADNRAIAEDGAAHAWAIIEHYRSRAEKQADGDPVWEWQTVSLEQLRAESVPVPDTGWTRWRDTYWAAVGRTNFVYRRDDDGKWVLLGERAFPAPGPHDEQDVIAIQRAYTASRDAC